MQKQLYRVSKAQSMTISWLNTLFRLILPSTTQVSTFPMTPAKATTPRATPSTQKTTASSDAFNWSGIQVALSLSLSL